MTDTPTTGPVCPVCEEEIEDGDGTYEGDVLYHYVCCQADEMDDGNWQHGVVGDEWGMY